MPGPIGIETETGAAIPSLGSNGKPVQPESGAIATDAASIAAAKAKAAEDKRLAEVKELADARTPADAKLAADAQERGRLAVEAAAARSTMNKAAVDARKTAEDLKRLVDEAWTLTVSAAPTDAKLLLDELESLQQENPDILKNPRAAKAFAALVALADSLSRARQPESVYRQARLAVRAIAAERLDLADAIVLALRREVSSNAPAYLVLKGAVFSFLTVTIVGFVAFALYLWVVRSTAASAMSFEASAMTAWTALSTNILVVSATFGLLGSLVSVLLRLSDFDGSRRSRQFLLFTGGVLPVVGAIFGVVVCALFASGIIGTSLVPEPATAETATIYFYMVAGFVAGFSERFARGLVDIFESNAGRHDDGSDGKPAK